MSGQNDTNYDLAGEVIGLAMSVHSELGHGYLESVYEEALCFELKNHNLSFEHQKQLTVFYQNHPVGHFVADVVVDSTLIVELKAISSLSTVHEVQLVNYLTAIKIDQGLLLNFGNKSLQFKKKFRQPIQNLSGNSV